MATFYVSQTAGVDTNPGTQSQPFRTVGKGASVAVAGDIVVTEGGTYNEGVLPPRSNVQYLAAAGSRPILDGGGTVANGFYANSTAISGLRIEGFEIRNFTGTGVYLGFQKGVDSNHVVHNNYIHDLGVRDSTTNVFGVYMVYGNARITSNEVRNVGTMSGNESSGIRTLYCHRHVIDGNTVEVVRKEGIRDYQGNLPTITNNKVGHMWAGLSLNQSLSAFVANNYSYQSVFGMEPKHTNTDYNKTFWGLDPLDTTIPWSRFYHNTFWHHSDANCYLASSLNPVGATDPGYMEQVDIQNNIFTGFSGSHINDVPGARRNGLIFDYCIFGPLGAYALPPTLIQDRAIYLYRFGYSFGSAGTTKTFAQTQTDLGWHLHSQQTDPLLNDPANGDLDYGSGSPAAAGGAVLPTQWGTQMGARGLGTSSTTFTHHRPAVTISSKSPEGSFNERTRVSDEMQFSYFKTASALDEWVIIDLQSSKTFNVIAYEPFGHAQSANVKGYRIETSPDNVTYTTQLEGATPDSGGAVFRFTFSAALTARYVRFTALTDWGAVATIYGDIRFYNAVRTGGTAPPPPATDTTAPTVALTAPADGSSVSGDVTVTATASDNVAVTKVEITAGGVLITTDTVSPYSAVWTTTSNDAGAKTITAKAYDAAGNTATDSRTVTVTTAPPPPPVTSGPYWGIKIG